MDVRSSPHILPDDVEWSDGYTCEIWVDDYRRKFPKSLLRWISGWVKYEINAISCGLGSFPPTVVKTNIVEHEKGNRMG